MGKWASGRRRGSAPRQGIMAPPFAAEFSIGTPTATTVPVTRLASYQQPADGWQARAVLASNGTQAGVSPGINGVGPTSIMGLTTATAYRIEATWYQGTTRISDWGPIGTATTA